VAKRRCAGKTKGGVQGRDEKRTTIASNQGGAITKKAPHVEGHNLEWEAAYLFT